MKNFYPLLILTILVFAFVWLFLTQLDHVAYNRCMATTTAKGFCGKK